MKKNRERMKQIVTLTSIQRYLWKLTIFHGSNCRGFIRKVNQMRLKHLYPWLTRTFSRTLVEKESHRIYRKMKRKRWKIGEKMYCLIMTITRLWVQKTKISDKQTDYKKTNEQIERSSFLKITILQQCILTEWRNKPLSGE